MMCRRVWCLNDSWSDVWHFLDDLVYCQTCLQRSLVFRDWVVSRLDFCLSQGGVFGDSCTAIPLILNLAFSFLAYHVTAVLDIFTFSLKDLRFAAVFLPFDSPAPSP